MKMDSKANQLMGKTAVAHLHEDTVSLSTQFGSPGEKEALQQKIELLDTLRELTAGIDGLVIPRVLDRDDARGEYLVDRAQGWNLSEQQGFKQGGIRGFMDLPIETKVKGLTTYLKVIGRLNEAGWAFVDHKPDSVFIDQNGVITIVDADGMEKQKDPWITDQNDRGGIQEVAQNFFSRGMDKLSLGETPDLLMPAGVKVVMSNLDSTASARLAAERIEGWMKNTYDPSKDYGYNPDTHRADIWKPGMTNFQYDIAEANHYLNYVKSKEAYQYYLQYLNRKGEE